MKAEEQLREYRGLDSEKLAEKVAGLEEELMKLRFRNGAGQLENSAQLKSVRKSIARVKTVISEQRAEKAEAKDA